MTDPVALLASDRKRAAELGDAWANLVVVSTRDERGEPHSRVLVLREIDSRLAIFANRTSPKVDEFDCSSTIAAMTYLASIQVQYRLQCRLSSVEPSVVYASWNERPDIPKRLDWLYQELPQSSVVSSREELLTRLHDIGERSSPNDDALGFFLNPIEIERLALDDTSGLHDRRRFTRDGDRVWVESVLVP